ncbi:hypothetical protein GCM10009839_45610 [Catenulispora yoronensis]|uniref:Uncharacterized protein n=1 Tax=Catenulispora yoronensis TaxID=450799 RepID=A0ABP5G6F2_9ACTN
MLSRKLAALLAVAVTALSTAALAGSANAAATDAATAKAWTQGQIGAQLHRKAGGTVQDNTITYANGVKLVYSAHTAGAAVTPDFVQCPSGNVCLSSDGSMGSIQLQTSSLWCDNELPAGEGSMYLGDYGLASNLRSANSENAYWVSGVWSYVNWLGRQHGIRWEMSPYGAVFNQSATNMQYVVICRTEADLH